MKLSQTHLAGAVVALLFVAAFPGAASASKNEPFRLAMLPGPGEGPIDAAGLVGPFARALDGTSLRFAPAPLPEGLEENLAPALVEYAVDGSPRTRAYLQSETSEYDVGGVVVITVSDVGSGFTLTVTGGAAPFEDGVWSLLAGPVPAESLFLPLGALADSTAVRFGALPAASRVSFDIDPAAEALFRRALIYGSLALADEALAARSDLEAARSFLGFRLCLAGNRKKGLALLDSVRPDLLGAYDEAVHEARIALTTGTGDEIDERVTTLENRFPGRFETHFFRGLAEASREEYETARRSFAEAIRQRPLDPVPHDRIGAAALREGYYDLAHDEFGRSLSLAPGGVEARIGIASALYSEGLLDEAAAALTPLPSPDPHGVRGTRPRFLVAAARAGLASAQGLFSEARGDLVRARDEAYRLGDEESLLDLTERNFYVYLEEGRLDSAWNELSELRYLAGSAPFFERGRPAAIAYLEGLLGAYRQDLGTVAAKRLEIETTPGANPGESELLDGLYSLEEGRGYDATPPLRRALHSGDDRFTRHLLGRAGVASGRYGSAVQDLEWVVERGESLLDEPLVLPLSFYYLGRALEERGDSERARLAYREFLHYWSRASASRPEKERALQYANPGVRERNDGRMVPQR